MIHCNICRRKGATLVLVSILLVVLICLVALAVDVSRMYLIRTQMQTAVDAGTIGAAQYLAENPTDIAGAVDAAVDFVQHNRVGSNVTVPENAIVVEPGNWNHATKSFTPNNVDPDCVRVFATNDQEPLFFSGVMGWTEFSAPRSAIATLGGTKFDIMMVLDLSGSMDSQGRIQALQAAAPAFVDVIIESSGDDHIGVMGYGALIGSYDPVGQGHSGSVYLSAPSNEYPPNSDWAGVIESPLTSNLHGLKTSTLSSSTLVANKYNGWTPTGAAIRDSAHYLDTNGRSGVTKVIVLMSDGKANKPTGNGSNYALQMASYAASKNIKVFTISLGNGADEILMEQIAFATGGQHFVATGTGQSSLTDKLTRAFERAAAALKGVQLVH